jgi:hypothetical protein
LILTYFSSVMMTRWKHSPWGALQASRSGFWWQHHGRTKLAIMWLPMGMR